MKVINTFFVLFLIGFVVSCASTQTPDFAAADEAYIKKLKKLGRKELIRLAAEKVRRLGDDNFNPENFDRIRVMAGKDVIYVSFSTSFKYVPQNSVYEYDANVYLDVPDNNSKYLHLDITSTPESNPKGYISKKGSGFFSPTEDSRKAIDFVLKTMNRTHKDGFYAKKTWPWGHKMIVRDKNDHYQIEERHPDSIGYYSIKKKSGEIYEEGHMHLLREPEIVVEGFEEKFEEIKE